MKKYIIVFAAMLMVLSMVSGAYAAGTATPNVGVSGTIVNTCVVGGAGTMAFGSLDANTNAGLTTPIMSGMTLWCTKGDSVTFAVGNGLNYAASTRNMKMQEHCNSLYGELYNPGGRVGEKRYNNHGH